MIRVRVRMRGGRSKIKVRVKGRVRASIRKRRAGFGEYFLKNDLDPLHTETPP
jgi:hypothetical protein